MITLKTLPNVSPDTRQFIQHELALPSCCPVSKNPFPGSTVLIQYRAHDVVLEIARLYAYIHQFKGGLRDDAGNLLVRDMEGMIQRIADDCAQVVGVPVRVVARLEIVPRQRMGVVARGYPLEDKIA